MIKVFLKEHCVAFVFATVVGFIYLAPNIFFIWSLGDGYKGIPMMATANEDGYLARIQEIIDGHPLLSSPFFYEYKKEWPLTPPTGELFYAIPSIILHISPANIIIASRFVLSFILFLLIYYLIYQLTIGASRSKKINAIAGALLVTLGYDLVDFRGVLAFLTHGQPLAGNFLLWARPVNPILGAIFLTSFLLFIWQIIQKSEKRRTNIVGASLFLALMIGSYFFSWGIAVSVLAVLVLIYLFKREYDTVRNFVYVLLIAFSALSLPYWYVVWQASKSIWYEESLLRSGLFFTHYPLLNKFVLATLFLYVSTILLQIIKDRAFFKNTEETFYKTINLYLKDWHWFCSALILGSLWVYNQQILTGKTVWPYHFVQYTIPLMMIVVVVLFYNIIKNWSVYIWKIGIFLLFSASLFFGIYTQASVYASSYKYYSGLQSAVPLFDWLNTQKKDCVVMVIENAHKGDSFNFLIPAFTHCNTYSSNDIFSIMPDERAYHAYLSNLAFRDVPTFDIKKFVNNNLVEARDYLFSNWKGVYGPKDFLDFSDVKLEERIAQVPQKYTEFMSRGLKNELLKYRLDYILSDTMLSQNILSKLPGLKLVFQIDDLFMYSF